MVEYIFEVIKSPEVRNIVMSYVATHGADSLINFAKKKFGETSIEHMLLDALNESLRNVCDKYNMEHDYDAIEDTFLVVMEKISVDTSKSGLNKILISAIGVQAEDNVLSDWITQFDISISKPERAWLYNYIQQADKREAVERQSCGISFVLDLSEANLHMEKRKQLSGKGKIRFREYNGESRVSSVDSNTVFFKLYEKALDADKNYFYTRQANYDPLDRYIIITSFKRAIHDTEKLIVAEVQPADIDRTIQQMLDLGLLRKDHSGSLHITEEGIEYFDYLVRELSGVEDSSDTILV